MSDRSREMLELTRDFDQRALEARAEVAAPARTSAGTATYSEAKPLRSRSMGCHPDQVEEFNAKVKERGISGVHYEPGTGVCVFSSRRGRNEEQRARSFFDQDAGYGDAMPNNV